MVHKTTNPEAREGERQRETERERESRRSGLETQTSAKSCLPEAVAEGGGHKIAYPNWQTMLTRMEAERGPDGLTERLTFLFLIINIK